MLSNQYKHETRNASHEDCVDDLVVALGMWIDSTTVTEMQAGCFIYSVLKLAKAAGVPRDRALRPFDVLHDLASRIWDELYEQDMKIEDKCRRQRREKPSP